MHIAQQHCTTPHQQQEHQSVLPLNSTNGTGTHLQRARNSLSSLESSSSITLMPINVKSMILHGVDDKEIITNWLKSIKCDDLVNNFVRNGYDMALLPRMTPQDLAAIGCKSPIVRKKLLAEIKKLNLEDDIPDYKPSSLNEWLHLLKLSDYHNRLCDEGYNTLDKVCKLTWEDLEEIGINKLGHQKRLLLGIERILKLEKQNLECLNESIYDVHPNHRVSLSNPADNRLSTLGRSYTRSGLFQTRPGANLDHRGLPVSTVVPALKHVNSSMANLEISPKRGSVNSDDATSTVYSNGTSNNNGEYELVKTSSDTIRRNPPPPPPIRTNSLKTESESNGIYGNGPTTFLRPKLGCLTPTTNKILVHAGHIQNPSIHNQQPQQQQQTTVTLRPMMPIREVPPPPPVPSTAVTELNQGIVVALHNNPSSLINDSLIERQLASADEFPPPPPTSQ